MKKILKRINNLGLFIEDGNDFIDLDPGRLINAAIKSTGLDDFGDMFWYPDFCRSINCLSAGKITVLGRLILKCQYFLELKNRLLMIEFIKKNPDVLKREIDDPVLILGNPRSGTSVLYEALAKDQNLRAPVGWEAVFPTGLYSEADRKGIAEGIFDLLMDIEPAMKKIHELSWRLPTEHLMTMTFDHHSLVDKSASKAFCGWLKISLQILQCQADKKTWLIKDPKFMMVIDDLLEFFPDARIIHLHRDPASSMASLFSLVEASMSSKGVEASLHEPENEIDYWREGCKKMINLKNKKPKNRIVDVEFKGLVGNPSSMVRKIYRDLGLPSNDRTLEKVSGYLKEKPRHKSGRRYDFGGYRLGEEVVRERFREYIEYYSVSLDVQA